jgi:hypothetical protein
LRKAFLTEEVIMNHGVKKQSLITGALVIVALLAGSAAFADGATGRERTMSRYAKCEWTDTMSKELYECVKRNNGFSTHWCFDETLQTNCEPEPIVAAAETQVVAQSEHQEDERKNAARQGEENLRGTIEREQTMLKYKDCEWTDEMGKHTYECVKRNNGFGTHWCYDEALQLYCPAPEAEPQG